VCVCLAEGLFPDSPAATADGCREMAALAQGDKAPADFDRTDSVCLNDVDSQGSPKINDPNLLWKTFISTLNRHHRRFGNSGSGLRMMLKRLQRINSSSKWETYMHGANFSSSFPR
jgi:hypothetical protein